MPDRFSGGDPSQDDSPVGDYREQRGSLTGHPVASGRGFVNFAMGCVLIPIGFVVLLIAGCSLWNALQPKQYSYDDVLTTANANQFATHNKDWSHDDPNNVQYVQRAMKHLGAAAFGRKFGDLMDWEKNYEAKQSRQKEEVEIKREEQSAAASSNNATSAPSDESSSGSTAIGLAIGDSAEITNTGTDGTPCFGSKEDIDAYFNAINANDQYGYQNVMGDAVATLHDGDHVRGLGTTGFLRPAFQLRIESGESAGTACWVPGGIVEYKNVKSE